MHLPSDSPRPLHETYGTLSTLSPSFSSQTSVGKNPLLLLPSTYVFLPFSLLFTLVPPFSFFKSYLCVYAAASSGPSPSVLECSFDPVSFTSTFLRVFPVLRLCSPLGPIALPPNLFVCEPHLHSSSRLSLPIFNPHVYSWVAIFADVRSKGNLAFRVPSPSTFCFFAPTPL